MPTARTAASSTCSRDSSWSRESSALESLPRSRPIALEAECVHRFLVLAELAGATPYVVHVTGRASFDEIEAARRRGMTVHGEVCPHHLLFDVSDHGGPDGLRYVMTPPLRTADDRAALLAGLTGGGLDTLASDQCHLRLDRDKLQYDGDFSGCPRGFPGSVPACRSGFALMGGDLAAAERLVEVACEAPARIFGLAGKGAVALAATPTWWCGIRPGPARSALESIDDGLDWTPYGGFDVPGHDPARARARRSRRVEDVRWRGDRPRAASICRWTVTPAVDVSREGRSRSGTPAAHRRSPVRSAAARARCSARAPSSSPSRDPTTASA